MEISTSKSKYALLGDLSLLVNTEIKKDLDYLRIERINESEIVKRIKKNINDNEIRSKLSSIRNIALGVTEGCNFRCKYCVYSGDYLYLRKHNQKRMNFKTAVRAIDFFLNLIRSNKRTRKLNKFGIGFYGGEPLLEFELIKEVIKYTRKQISWEKFGKDFEIEFRITTNGSLLKENVVDFLKEEDVFLDISIDGPKEEHDRYRVYKNGGGTWDIIMENIKRIRKKYPDYYKTRVEHLSTIHPAHDQDKIERFFKTNTKLFDFDRIRFSSVSGELLKSEGKKKLINESKKKIGRLILLNAIKYVITDKFKLRSINHIHKFTGACFPGGEKVFVDVDGRFHICEKISPYYPIGDVDRGFDIRKIKNMLHEYNREIIEKKCWNCEFWFMCGICFVHVAKKGELVIECDDIRQGYPNLLKSFLEKMEVDDEEINNSYFNSVSDYIEQL